MKTKKTSYALLGSCVLLALSFLLLIGAVAAWFRLGNRAEFDGWEIAASSPAIESLEASFYRSDGVRYDFATGKSYDDAGVEQREEFRMPEYDSVIPAKNVTGNLIMAVTATLGDPAAGLAARVVAGNVSAGGAYYLSDVVGIACAPGFEIAAGAVNSEIYRAARQAFDAAAETRNFVDAAGSKTSALEFAVTGSGTVRLLFNITYEKTLVERLFADVAGFGTPELGVDLAFHSDLVFQFGAGGAVHA